MFFLFLFFSFFANSDMLINFSEKLQNLKLHPENHAWQHYGVHSSKLKSRNDSNIGAVHKVGDAIVLLIF